MRAGLSLLEEENIWSTNPLFLTNREAALSEVGEAQVRNACRLLSSSGKSPTVVRYSLAAACVDSANVVGEELRVRLLHVVIIISFSSRFAILSSIRTLLSGW
jgi:hypothetical protein